MDMDRWTVLQDVVSRINTVMDMDCFTFIGESEKWGTIVQALGRMKNPARKINELLEVVRLHSHRYTRRDKS